MLLTEEFGLVDSVEEVELQEEALSLPLYWLD